MKKLGFIKYCKDSGYVKEWGYIQSAVENKENILVTDISSLDRKKTYKVYFDEYKRPVGIVEEQETVVVGDDERLYFKLEVL